MTTRKIDAHRRRRRGRGDDGAALVEFAFVSVLLLTLIFGIINFGLILNFDQDVTRAAAEGARGGAVAVKLNSNQTSGQAAQAAAASATSDAVKQISSKFKTLGCSTPGMHCPTPVVAPCAGQTAYQCVTVTVTYDYKSKPLFGNLPIVSAFFPNTVSATSVARINS